MECPVCCNSYATSGDRLPYLLPCGHSYCLACLQSLAAGRALQCPQRCTFRDPALKVKDLNKNFALIDQLERLERTAAQRATQHKDPCAGLDDERGEGVVTRYRLPFGSVLAIKPPLEIVPRVTERPQAVVVLDRSPSMGGALRWVINVAVPEGLMRLGYRAEDPVVLITFDSSTETVQQRGRPPTLNELRSIPVTGRGTGTLMGPAVERLGGVLSRGGAFNVVVISDGFVEDMDHVRRAATAGAMSIPSDSRIAFSLIRFFNGYPPDTVALSMCGALGTVGPAPVVDCEPPSQWECGVCTFLNPSIAQRCEMCDTPCGRNAHADGKDDTALDIFVRTFADAFSTNMLPHVAVRGAGISRVPRVLDAEEKGRMCSIEVPIGVESFVQAEGDGVEVAGRWCKAAVRSVAGETGLGLSGQIEGAVTPFFSAVLAQLRLWLLAGTRSDELQQVVGLCRRVLDERGDEASGGTGVIHRAWALRKRLEATESPLSRISAFSAAQEFVVELGSKQQGDFLRSSSVTRADRLLSRRAFGPDIIYHDACRGCLATCGAPAPSECEARSAFGGAQYADSVRAAKCLGGVAEDLVVADILQVIGGLGVGFAGRAENVDDAWTLEVSQLDASRWLGESDIWAAKERGEPLMVGEGKAVLGVVPLASCGPQSHKEYLSGPLRPVALLQLGSQLHGELPRKPWGWANLFPNPAGGAPDPSHALGDGMLARAAACLVCASRDYMGAKRTPSPREAQVVAGLLDEIRVLAADVLINTDHCLRLALGSLQQGDVTRPVEMLQASSSPPGVALRVIAALAVVAEAPSPRLLRTLLEHQVHASGRQHLSVLPDAVRREMVLTLCCPEGSRPAVHSDDIEAEHRRRRKIAEEEEMGNYSSEGRAPVEHARVKDCPLKGEAELIEGLSQLAWMPSWDGVLGLARCLSTFPATPEKLQAARPVAPAEGLYGIGTSSGAGVLLAGLAVTAILGKGRGYALRAASPSTAMQELRQLVHECHEADYAARLDAEVRKLDYQRRACVVEMQRTYVPGKETGGYYDIFSDPDYLVVLCNNRAPWAPAGWWTPTRRPRCF